MSAGSEVNLKRWILMGLLIVVCHVVTKSSFMRIIF